MRLYPIRLRRETAHPIGILLADASQYLGGEFLSWMLLEGRRRKFYITPPHSYQNVLGLNKTRPTLVSQIHDRETHILRILLVQNKNFQHQVYPKMTAVQLNFSKIHTFPLTQRDLYFWRRKGVQSLLRS